MKKKVLAIIILLLTTLGLHAQNQFSLNIDTTKTGLLGFNKQNRWPLSAKEPRKLQNFNFLEGPEDIAHKKGFETNMPIHEPDGNYPLVIHIPDSTINYKIQVVEPSSTNKSAN